MPYPDRKPIYDAYKIIIDKIIAEKEWKSFAEAEIDDLDSSLLRAFKEIRISNLSTKDWPKENL